MGADKYKFARANFAAQLIDIGDITLLARFNY